MRIVFLGDSITDANHLFTSDNLGEGYVKNIARSFEWNDEVDIVNKGYNGYTIKRMHNLINEVVSKEPDVISILIGVNDLAEYMQGIGFSMPEMFEGIYVEILENLLENTNAKIVIMEPFIFEKPEEFKLWKKQLQKYINVINSVKKRFEEYGKRIGYIDLYSRFDEMERVYGSDYLTTDGIHLTEEGHKFISDWWMEELSNLV